MKPLIPAIIAALLPLAALAEGQVSVQDAYARAANPKSGAAFMTIVNGGKDACTLMGVTTDAAARAESKTPLEHFAAFYEAQNGQPLSDEQAAFCQSLIEDIWKEDEA